VKEREEGLAMPQTRHLVTGFQLRWPGYDARLGHVGFVVAKEALERIFSDDFGFSCQILFRLNIPHSSIIIIIIIRGWYNTPNRVSANKVNCLNPL
jgi:hypothetical protein